MKSPLSTLQLVIAGAATLLLGFLSLVLLLKNRQGGSAEQEAGQEGNRIKAPPAKKGVTHHKAAPKVLFNLRCPWTCPVPVSCILVLAL
jgi:hypothetical protein